MIGFLLSLSPLFIAFCGKSPPVKSRSGSSTSLSSEKIPTPRAASQSKSAEVPTRTADKKSSEDLKKIEADQEKLKVKILAELEELANWFKKHLPKCGFTAGKEACECLDLKRKASAIVEKYSKELQELPSDVGKEKTEEKSKETKSKDGKKRRKPKQEKSKQPDSGDKISKMSITAPVDAVMGEYEALIDKENVVTHETQNSDST